MPQSLIQTDTQEEGHDGYIVTVFLIQDPMAELYIGANEFMNWQALRLGPGPVESGVWLRPAGNELYI